jgi:hypothetical protein
MPSVCRAAVPPPDTWRVRPPATPRARSTTPTSTTCSARCRGRWRSCAGWWWASASFRRAAAAASHCADAPPRPLPPAAQADVQKQLDVSKEEVIDFTRSESEEQTDDESEEELPARLDPALKGLTGEVLESAVRAPHA